MSAWGWWGLLAVFLLGAFLRMNAPGLGIIAALVTKQPALALLVGVILAALIATRFAFAWLVVHSPEVALEATEPEPSVISN
jgi:hypothetical protein